MKKRFLKIVAAVAALVMVVSMCGCGNKTATSGGDIPTLKWLVPGSSQPGLDEVLAEVNKITAETIGAKLDIQFIDEGAYDEKMTVNMASGSDYDLCFTGYINNYAKAVRNQALYCMDDLLKTTPALVESIDDYAWEASKYNGKIYAVPNMQIHASSMCLAFRKDLVDKYNFDVLSVKKTQDIEPFLELVAKNEPNYYPYRTNFGLKAITSMYEPPIYFHDYQNGCYAIGEVDGKVKAVEYGEYINTKEKSALMHEWFKKGYIRPDVATVTDDTQAYVSGKYAVWVEAYKPGVEAEYKNNSGVDIEVVPISKPIIDASSVRATMIGIGNNCKHPELAIKMIEQLNTNKEIYNLICYGIEGVHYNKVGENRIEVIPNSNYNPNASWKFGNQFNAYLLPGQADDVWERTKELNASALVSPVSGLDLNLDDVRVELTQCNNVSQRYAFLQNGSSDPKGAYEASVQETKEAGIDKIIETVQKQVDEFLKNK